MVKGNIQKEYKQHRFVVVVAVLLFYVHGKPSKAMSGRSVNLITLFLGRLRAS